MGKTILFIENESDQVMLMKKRFEASGYEFVYALDGREGLEKAKSAHPDIILLDLNLIEMSGFEVLKALQANSTLKKIPVYIITARMEPHLIEYCQKLGATEIIFKPYDSHK